MHYNFNLEIPASTLQSAKEVLVCPVSYGVLRKVIIYFRGGCADLAHVEIWKNERQIFPTNPGDDYAFDDYAIEFEEFYPILDKPYQLQVKGYNEDDTFSHIVSFLFLVLHPLTTGKPESVPTTEEELTDLLGEYQLLEGI